MANKGREEWCTKPTTIVCSPLQRYWSAVVLMIPAIQGLDSDCGDAVCLVPFCLGLRQGGVHVLAARPIQFDLLPRPATTAKGSLSEEEVSALLVVA